MNEVGWQILTYEFMTDANFKMPYLVVYISTRYYFIKKVNKCPFLVAKGYEITQENIRWE